VAKGSPADCASDRSPTACRRRHDRAASRRGVQILHMSSPSIPSSSDVLGRRDVGRSPDTKDRRRRGHRFGAVVPCLPAPSGAPSAPGENTPPTHLAHPPSILTYCSNAMLVPSLLPLLVLPLASALPSITRTGRCVLSASSRAARRASPADRAKGTRRRALASRFDLTVPPGRLSRYLYDESGARFMIKVRLQFSLGQLKTVAMTGEGRQEPTSVATSPPRDDRPTTPMRPVAQPLTPALSRRLTPAPSHRSQGIAYQEAGEVAADTEANAAK